MECVSSLGRIIRRRLPLVLSSNRTSISSISWDWVRFPIHRDHSNYTHYLYTRRTCSPSRAPHIHSRWLTQHILRLVASNKRISSYYMCSSCRRVTSNNEWKRSTKVRKLYCAPGVRPFPNNISQSDVSESTATIEHTRLYYINVCLEIFYYRVPSMSASCAAHNRKPPERGNEKLNQPPTPRPLGSRRLPCPTVRSDPDSLNIFPPHWTDQHVHIRV